MIDPNAIITAVISGKLSEIEAERLVNALTRYESHVPTGISDPQLGRAKHLDN